MIRATGLPSAASLGSYLGTNVKSTESLIVSAGDESTAITTGTAKVTFRMPYAFTLSDVRGSLTTAQSSGSALAFDLQSNGTTVFSTKPTFDNNEKTTVTASTSAALSITSLADDASMTVNVDTIGASGAAGLKVTLIGNRT